MDVKGFALADKCMLLLSVLFIFLHRFPWFVLRFSASLILELQSSVQVLPSVSPKRLVVIDTQVIWGQDFELMMSAIEQVNMHKSSRKFNHKEWLVVTISHLWSSVVQNLQIVSKIYSKSSTEVYFLPSAFSGIVDTWGLDSEVGAKEKQVMQEINTLGRSFKSRVYRVVRFLCQYLSSWWNICVDCYNCYFDDQHGLHFVQCFDHITEYYDIIAWPYCSSSEKQKYDIWNS